MYASRAGRDVYYSGVLELILEKLDSVDKGIKELNVKIEK
jgi:hypothetical protein